jgi:hypothetical protein
MERNINIVKMNRPRKIQPEELIDTKHEQLWYYEKRTKCECCNYNLGNITKCIYCDMAICAGCLSDGQFCVMCVNNDNTLEACQDWLTQKNKIRLIKIDTNTGDIIPIKKRWWMSCFY